MESIVVDVWFFVGLFAQALFSARFLAQWLASEKAGRSVMPVWFWHFSVSGSAVLAVYAWARHDPVFVLCQVVNLLIYARNLQLLVREKKGLPPPRTGPLQTTAVVLLVAGAALAAVLAALRHGRGGGGGIPIGWLVVGFAGQMVFNARFALQILTSERQGRSVVPVSFWYCSMVGSALLLLYAVWRRDPIFILGQAPNVFIYLRNLQLIDRQRSAPTEESRSLQRGWLLMLLLAVASFFLFQGTRPIYGSTEGRYALCAREMLDSGNWLEPTLLGRPHWSKPPFAYWATAGGLSLLGTNAWGARVPAAAAGLITVLAVAGLGTKLWGAKAGLVAGLVWSTAPFPVLAANTLNADTYLTMWLVLTVLAYWGARLSTVPAQSRRWVLALWAFLGMAFFTKGPPALLVLVPITGFHFTGRERPRRPALFSSLGLALFAVLASWWFVAVCSRHPGLFRHFIGFEVVDRLISDVHGRNPEWYQPLKQFGIVLAFGTGLWSWWAWREMWRRRPWTLGCWQRVWQEHGPALFLALWFWPCLLVFSLARSRLPNYVLPLAVPIALFVGRVLASSWQRGPLPRRILIVALASCGILVAGKALSDRGPSDRRNMGELYELCRSDDEAGIRFCLFRSAGHAQGIGFYLHAPLIPADVEGNADGLPALTDVLAQFKADAPDARLTVVTRLKHLAMLTDLAERAGWDHGEPRSTRFWAVVPLSVGRAGTTVPVPVRTGEPRITP